MIGAIFAQSANGVIGLGGKIPWSYKGDLKRFKRVTLGSTIVMGRKTFESIGKPLPGRRNIVLTRGKHAQHAGAVLTPPNEYLIANGGDPIAFVVDRHRETGDGDLWFIGGAEVYAAAMPYCDLLDVTYVPDVLLFKLSDQPVFAPHIDETLFDPGELLCHEDDPSLRRRVFIRRTLPEAPYDLSDNRRLQEAGILSRRPR